MATEQELELRVTLDDQATPQLLQIRAALGKLGGEGGQNPLAPVVQNIDTFEKALGALARAALGVGKAAIDMAKVIGPVPWRWGPLPIRCCGQLRRSKQWAKL
jgi:hypothetical protein